MPFGTKATKIVNNGLRLGYPLKALRTKEIVDTFH